MTSPKPQHFIPPCLSFSCSFFCNFHGRYNFSNLSISFPTDTGQTERISWLFQCTTCLQNITESTFFSYSWREALFSYYLFIMHKIQQQPMFLPAWSPCILLQMVISYLSLLSIQFPSLYTNTLIFLILIFYFSFNKQICWCFIVYFDG